MSKSIFNWFNKKWSGYTHITQENIIIGFVIIIFMLSTSVLFNLLFFRI